MADTGHMPRKGGGEAAAKVLASLARFASSPPCMGLTAGLIARTYPSNRVIRLAYLPPTKASAKRVSI